VPWPKRMTIIDGAKPICSKSPDAGGSPSMPSCPAPGFLAAYLKLRDARRKSPWTQIPLTITFAPTLEVYARGRSRRFAARPDRQGQGTIPSLSRCARRGGFRSAYEVAKALSAPLGPADGPQNWCRRLLEGKFGLGAVIDGRPPQSCP